MDRREFMKGAAILTMGATIAAPFLLENPAQAAAPTSSVVVAKGSDWAKLVGKAIAPLGGIKAFVKKGAKVFVKPNMSFDRPPEYASNTHPLIVKSVVQLCLDAGAGQVTVMDHTLSDKRRCYQNSGIVTALQSISDKRLKIIFAENRDFRKVDIPKGVALKKWPFHRALLEADAYITVPVAKHHGSAKLTLGLKNVMGVTGGMRGLIHRSLDQGIADLNTIAKPKLTVIDATRILLRHGPSGGNLRDVETKNTVIASADAVAADAIAAKTLFNMNPKELAYIAAANKHGLGEMNLSKIKVVNA